MDSVSKRRLAASIYILSWAFKIQYLFKNLLNPTNVILLWCITDFVFFVGLKRSKIPWMTLSILSTLAIILGSCILNIGIIGKFSKPFGNKLEPSVVKTEPKLVLKNDYIHGSHKVHVRQPTIAKFNPNNTHFCFLKDASVQEIPILIKGIPPWSIDLEIIHMNGTTSILSNLDVNQSHLVHQNQKQEPNDLKRKTLLYAIPVFSPGLYKLLKIMDLNGDLGKVSKSHAEIVPCPSANWIDNEGGNQKDSCMNELASIGLEVNGVAPLQVWFSKYVPGAAESIVSVADIGVENSSKGNVKFSLAQSMKLESEIQVRIGYPKDHVLQILRVMDSRNNTIDYSFKSESSLPPLNTGSSYYRVPMQGSEFVVHGRAIPHASFLSCENIVIKMDETGMNAFEPVHLGIALSGNGDWSLSFGRTFSEAFTESLQDLQTLDHIPIDQTKVYPSVHLPGTYVLNSVHDRYCRGSILQPSTCSIIGRLPPTLSVSSAPIETACVGAIGISSNLSFTGEPPFWVAVEHEWKGAREIEVYEDLKTRHSIRFEPKNHGMHHYRFLKVGDSTYPKGVSVEHSISQNVHAQSSASFMDRNPLIRCINDTATVKVEFQGSGPWTLSYEIMHDNKKQSFTLKDISSTEIDIKTPKLQKNGLHVLSLIEITDANGCTNSLDSEDVSINVMAQRPMASFACPDLIYYLEGQSALLPVTLTGKGHFKVSYVDTANPSQVFAIETDSTTIQLPVTSPSVYRLTALKDSFCEGRIVNPLDCKAVLIERPTLYIEDSEFNVRENGMGIRTPVCQDYADSLRVRMTGKPPFQLLYTHNFTSEKMETRVSQREEIISEFEDQNGVPFAEISLMTQSPGIHRYEFTSISDQNYVDAFLLKKSWIMEHQVFSKPFAQFVDSKDKYFQCLSETPGEITLQIGITGKGPFNLTLIQQHDNSKPIIVNRIIQEDDVKNSIYNFDPGQLKLIGTHTFSLLSFSDSTTCETLYDGQEKPSQSQISIHVTDQAKITSNSKNIVCVGDMITYSLQGTPPFVVGYTWNNKSMPDLTLHDPYLSLYASEAGVISISKVCNAMGCCNNLIDGMSTIVKDIPTVLVNGGEDVIEDIKEGDESTMVLEFKGEPPFQVTWTREQEEDKATPPDSFSESDIMSKTFSVKTSQEGEFKVTSIHDKYCGYPRSVQNAESANAILKDHLN